MEDDARSSAGSVNSWINVDQVEQPDPWAADVPDEDGLELPPADLRFNKAPLDPIPEQVAPPPPSASTAAPVTQAARNLVDNVNEPPASRRLRRQQELAQKKGKKGARFVQLGAHNACNISLPTHIQQVGSGQGERSIMVLDHRDQRLQSPFSGVASGWDPDECQCQDQCFVGRSSGEVSDHGLSLQHFHDEDARQF